MERSAIRESDLVRVLAPGELAPVIDLQAAFDVRVLSDDPWFRLLPPQRMPARIRLLYLDVLAACRGAADRDSLLNRARAAAAGEWDVAIHDDDPDDPRSWLIMELRIRSS